MFASEFIPFKLNQSIYIERWIFTKAFRDFEQNYNMYCLNTENKSFLA